LLQEALAGRLSEVEKRLGTEAPASPTTTDSPPNDPEELLRLLMVRLWPQVARGDAGEAQLRAFLDHILALKAPAAHDLRFLDAWNNAYEALGLRAGNDFLAAYAELLQAHLARLDVA
jgi:hypothetical protein